MAAALADDGFDAGLECVQFVQGDKGLDGACKSAAVDTDGALAGQQMLGGGDGDGDFLVGGIAGGNHVLQVFPAAAARLIDQGQEGLKVPGPECGHLTGDPVVVGIDMEGPEDGAVAAGGAAGRNVGQEGLEGNIPQDFTAADLGHTAAVGGDGGVLIGQVGMVGARVQNAQGQAGLGEVHFHRLHHRAGGIGSAPQRLRWRKRRCPWARWR